MSNKIEVLETRVRSFPVIAFLLFIATGVTVLAAYMFGYLPGSLAFTLWFGAVGLYWASVSYHSSLKEKLQIEKAERLTNGEPLAVFAGVTKYRIKSDDGKHHDWETLTDDREQDLIRTGLLKSPVRREL